MTKSITAFLLPGWIAVALVLRLIWMRGQPTLFRSALVGLGVYALLCLGWLAMSPSSIARLAMSIAGHAALFGWAVSPTGMQLLWTPIGVLVDHWPEHMKPSRAVWGQQSTKLAIAVVLIDLIGLLVIELFVTPSFKAALTR